MTTDTPTKLRVHIRWMIRRDMPEVLDIERKVFEYPWFEEDFIRCLRERNVIAMVAEYEERVVGFVIYELLKTRIEILSFAVEGDSQRRGIGTQMINKLIGKLSSQRRKKITLAVRERNVEAQLFFRRMGFLAIGVDNDLYERSDEGGILFERQSVEGEDYQTVVLPIEIRRHNKSQR